MRLIDADKLKAHYSWWGSEGASGELKERKADFDVIVDLQPTVEAEPITRVRWIDIKKELPGESGYYLTWTPNLGVERLHYSAKYKQFNYFDTMRPVDHSEYELGDHVTHWAFLPEPPQTNGKDKL